MAHGLCTPKIPRQRCSRLGQVPNLDDSSFQHPSLPFSTFLSSMEPGGPHTTDSYPLASPFSLPYLLFPPFFSPGLGLFCPDALCRGFLFQLPEFHLFDPLLYFPPLHLHDICGLIEYRPATTCPCTKSCVG